MPSYSAKEFDLSKGSFTGRNFTIAAKSTEDAAKILAYQLNADSKGWLVGPSKRTVGNTQGDRAWYVEKGR